MEYKCPECNRDISRQNSCHHCGWSDVPIAVQGEKISSNEEASESEASSEYAYVEFDQSLFSGGEERVRNYVNSYAGKGWRLHSFNVIKLQGLILFQKQRYCLMFENPNKLRGKD